MSWFKLDPPHLAARADGMQPPTLSESLWRGIIGFTLVSVAGFIPWAVFGRWFKQAGGELGMYIACAAVFIGLSGRLLHGLIMGHSTLGRFYKLFTITFTAYSIAWIVAYVSLRGHLGSVVGLLAGTAIMGWLLVIAFEAKEHQLKVVAALFVFNSLGYFIGGWIETALFAARDITLFSRATVLLIAKLQWGVCYGIGFGAGLGLAFYICQTRARALHYNTPPADIS